MLIGGSALMVKAAELLVAKGMSVGFILAPRYRDKVMSERGETLEVAAERLGADLYLIDDINHEYKQFEIDLNAMALCFGPVWIFSENVRKRFKYGMFNYNAIPQPKYVGGAHHSWQIMNVNIDGGCVLQEIGAHVDHGDILIAEYYQFPSISISLQDYTQYKNKKSFDFIQTIIERITDGDDFECKDYSEINESRLYFPRLMNERHAYIDWRWKRDDIVRFCYAFGKPYDGAMTYYQGNKVYINAAEMINHEPFHPFCSGLIVRKTEDYIYVATTTGIISIKSLITNKGFEYLQKVKEGGRLYTPLNYLDEAMRCHIEIDNRGNLVPLIDE